MAYTRDYIRNLLKVMGFSVLNGTKEIWEKKYSQHDDYFIQVNFDTTEIIYETGKEEECVLVSSKTTSNFSKDENFVELECVNRLLEQGYKPNVLELEHSWPSGHGTSGRLDIWVKKDNNSYLMIECKTYGKEFKKEINNMLQANKNGESKGQLLAYFWEENKTTEYLCLYASVLQDGDIKIDNSIIPVEDSWKSLSNKKELFDHWNKSFRKNGIFESYIKPYNIECKALLRGDLEKITCDGSSRIFNQFLEILRHNAVSDKPNAFNKILNLFICKIIDEDRNDNEELQFQWKDDSTYISLQSSLEELYKQGMDRFLDIEVTDYSEDDIEKNLLSMDSKSKAVIRKMFQELRLQKNPEFAFKEVYNQESFEENAKVLKEVVEILQLYQFRYGHKQQFLGNFFEQLLNTSIKQESGQFFTPVPIARFMISSIPIKNIIDRNIEKNKKEILPIAIDYACGSGHFITEYMDIVQLIINDYDTTGLKKSFKNEIEKWKQTDNEDDLQGEFEWAKECVYGIEKDYRLVKTSKISTFLNGDGEANIIHADGLDKFTSDKYKGLLRSTNRENGNFDILIANPPYSVSAFKQTLQSDQNDFSLYSLLTENSSEIECLFVERANQLLKEGAYAAIILPSSILTNSSEIYEHTREILLKHFFIKAIAKMGDNTFMATGTNTVILFLKKRQEIDNSIINKLINEFFTTYKDFTYCGVPNVINRFISECFEEISFSDYISLIKHTPNKPFKTSDYYKELVKIFENYKGLKELKNKKTFKILDEAEKEVQINKLFNELIDQVEKKRLFYYLLTFNNKTLLIKTGEKQDEKDFLGYEFSNRRGNEGIHYYLDENGQINSSLYDELELNQNVNKANYYINQAFIGEYPEIPESLKTNLSIINTSNLIRYSTSNILDISHKKVIFFTKYNKCKIGDLITDKVISILSGYTFDKEYQGNNNSSDIPFYKVSDMNSKGNEIFMKYSNNYVTKEILETEIKGKIYQEGSVIFTKLGKAITTNKKRILSINACFDNNIMGIYSNNKDVILNEYLFIIMNSINLMDVAADSNPPSISTDLLKEIKIPVPPINIQENLIKDYFSCISQIENDYNKIYEIKKEINSIIEGVTIYENKSLYRLGCIFNPGKDELLGLDDNIKVSFVEMSDLNEDGYISKIVEKSLKNVKKGYTYFGENDIIIAKITPCMENGKCAVAKGLTNGIGFGSTEYHVIRTDNTTLLSEYVFAFLNREEVRQLAKAQMTGKSGHRRVPEDFYKNVQIPDMPYPEQQKFVDNIKVLNKKITSLQKEIEEIQERQKSLLHKYI